MSTMSGISLTIQDLETAATALKRAAEGLKGWLSAHPEDDTTTAETPREGPQNAPESTPPEPTPVQAAEPTPAPVQKPKQITLDDLRVALANASAAGYAEQIRALIASYGVTKLSHVSKTDYQALMDAVAMMTGNGGG